VELLHEKNSGATRSATPIPIWTFRLAIGDHARASHDPKIDAAIIENNVVTST